MTNNNKLRTGIFAMAMMLLCNPQGWAQTEKVTDNAPAATAKGSSTVQRNSVNEANTAKRDHSCFLKQLLHQVRL